MPDLPEAVDPEAFFNFTMGLADLLATLSKVVASQAEDVRELREDVAGLGTRAELESQLRAHADEVLQQEHRELDRRLTDVHRKALTALNTRYAPKGNL